MKVLPNLEVNKAWQPKLHLFDVFIPGRQPIKFSSYLHKCFQENSSWSVSKSHAQFFARAWPYEPLLFGLFTYQAVEARETSTTSKRFFVDFAWQSQQNMQFFTMHSAV